MSTGQVEWYSHLFEGDRWEDLRFPATAINPVGQSAPPTLNEDNGTLEFSATLVNTIAFQVQMPHAWREGSTIRPHLHARKKTEGAGNIVWQFTYEFANVGDVFTDSPTTLTSSTPAPLGQDDGSALKHLIWPFDDIDMTRMNVSCMALCTLSRLGNDSGDTYAGVAQLLEFDIHHIVDSLGSEALYTKQNTRGGVGI
jgi:hypothetical protein